MFIKLVLLAEFTSPFVSLSQNLFIVNFAISLLSHIAQEKIKLFWFPTLYGRSDLNHLLPSFFYCHWMYMFCDSVISGQLCADSGCCFFFSCRLHSIIWSYQRSLRWWVALWSLGVPLVFLYRGLLSGMFECDVWHENYL